MAEVDFGKGISRGRLWRRDVPLELACSNPSPLLLALRTTPSGAGHVLRVAAEVFLPGPKADCGVLGLDYLPDPRLTEMAVEIHAARSLGVVLDWTLASDIDEVHSGLPEEYAPAVVEALRASEPICLAPGVLRFCYAAHGMVGSSPSVFAALATGLLRVATVRKREVSSDDLVEWFLGPRRAQNLDP